MSIGNYTTISPVLHKQTNTVVRIHTIYLRDTFSTSFHSSCLHFQESTLNKTTCTTFSTWQTQLDLVYRVCKVGCPDPTGQREMRSPLYHSSAMRHFRTMWQITLHTHCQQLQRVSDMASNCRHTKIHSRNPT